MRTRAHLAEVIDDTKAQSHDVHIDIAKNSEPFHLAAPRGRKCAIWLSHVRCIRGLTKTRYMHGSPLPPDLVHGAALKSRLDMVRGELAMQK